MIWYIVTKRHAYTLRRYLRTWGRPLVERFGIATYEALLADPTTEAPPRTYIFSDIERLSPTDAVRAAEARDRILERVADARILNPPTRSMRRYELLRTLFERGDNTFNVYRLTEGHQPQRWPVFIREENEHTKSLSVLLHSPEALEAAVAELDARGYSREDKLVVEFCDTRDDQGLFYKYGAYLTGERIIPCHVKASRHWVAGGRHNLIKTPEVLEKERRYVQTNPHEGVLREIFRLARIDFGRIDYSMLGDRMQVWEINTNPMFFTQKPHSEPERQALLSHVAEQIAAAFAEIDVQDAPYDPGPEASFSL